MTSPQPIDPEDLLRHIEDLQQTINFLEGMVRDLRQHNTTLKQSLDIVRWKMERGYE